MNASAAPRRTPPDLRAVLAAWSAVAPETSLTEEAVVAGEVYLRHLVAAMGRTNLVGFRDPMRIVEECLLDGIGLAGVLDEADWTADIGSGAGLPGIGFALARPGEAVYLIEPRALRAEFLAEVVAAMKWPRLKVIRGRLQTWIRPPGTALYIARAAAAPKVVAQWVREHGKPEDQLFVAGAVHERPWMSVEYEVGDREREGALRPVYS